MSLEVPFRLLKIDMFEMSKLWNRQIEQILTYLTEGKVVVFETPNFETTYRIYYEEIGDSFVICDMDKAIDTYKTPIDFINWIYEKAPYIAMVGYENV